MNAYQAVAARNRLFTSSQSMWSMNFSMYSALRLVIVDVELVFVHIDHHQRNSHSERSHRVFVADDVVEVAVDWVKRQHGPARRRFGARLKVVRPIL